MKIRNEILIDLKKCDTEFSKRVISDYIKKICKLIKMERHGKIIIWEDSHNKIKELRGGISAFQFIKTSSVTLHSFSKFNSCYINIFSCKKFDMDRVAKFSKQFFKAKKMRIRKI